MDTYSPIAFLALMFTHAMHILIYCFSYTNAAAEFAPDITIISAGFDAARGDPLGCCDVRFLVILPAQF